LDESSVAGQATLIMSSIFHCLKPIFSAAF
jgi:hypothetical protein